MTKTIFPFNFYYKAQNKDSENYLHAIDDAPRKFLSDFEAINATPVSPFPTEDKSIGPFLFESMLWAKVEGWLAAFALSQGVFLWEFPY